MKTKLKTPTLWISVTLFIMCLGGAAEEKVSMDRAEGALLGVFVGDAAGATLEFLDVPITHSMAAHALHMPGGGIHAVGPGQATDDSELTIALARALKGHHPIHGFPADSVAVHRAWYASLPFDVGTTCTMAFRGSGAADVMQAFALRHNHPAIRLQSDSRHSSSKTGCGLFSCHLAVSLWLCSVCP
ncbi:hypothetical protein L7F22_020990 [Adiantum nelumboides]|nr:hypothetical protein [Adiantum nelumboides]